MGLIVLLFPTLAFGQGVAVRSLSGFATNLTAKGTTIMQRAVGTNFYGSGSGLSNVIKGVVAGTDISLVTNDGVVTISSTAAGGTATNVIDTAASPSIDVATNGFVVTPSLSSNVTNDYRNVATNAARTVVALATNKLDIDLRTDLAQTNQTVTVTNSTATVGEITTVIASKVFSLGTNTSGIAYLAATQTFTGDNIFGGTTTISNAQFLHLFTGKTNYILFTDGNGELLGVLNAPTNSAASNSVIRLTSATTTEYADLVAGGGSGDSVWTNSGGVLQPVSTNAIRILSEGQLRLGTNSLSDSTATKIVMVNDTSLGDPTTLTPFYFISQSDPGLTTYGEFGLSIVAGGGGNLFFGGFDAGGADAVVEITSVPSDPYIKISVNSTMLLGLQPAAADGTTPYTFDTSVLQTTSAEPFIAFKNKGTNNVVISPYSGIGLGQKVYDAMSVLDGSSAIISIATIDAGESATRLIYSAVLPDSSFSGEASFSAQQGMADQDKPTSTIAAYVASTNGSSSSWDIKARVDASNPSELTFTRGSLITFLRPDAAASATPYSFGTTLSHFSGNLLEVKNAGVLVFAIPWNGITFAAYYSNIYVTNAFIEIANVNKLTVNNFYALDGTVTNGIYFVDQDWTGPTNSIDLRLQSQFYDTLTPMLIQGFANKSNTVSQSVVLTVRNLSSTNVTLTLPVGVRDADGTNNYTLLPGGTNDYIWSFRYSAKNGGHTNAVHRRFFSP